MMNNQNGGDVHPEAALPSSPSEQLMRERLRACQDMYSSLDDQYLFGTSPFSSSSDLQTLESSFRRFGVSDASPSQQPLLDHRRNNQSPFNGRDPGINVHDYYNTSYFQPETVREQINMTQRLRLRKDNRVNGYDDYESSLYDDYRSSRYGSYGPSNSGVVVRPPYVNGNFVEVPFSPSNHNSYDQNPWSYSHGYVSGTSTSRDPFTMNNSRATDTTLSRAKDRVKSIELINLIGQGSREIIDKIFDGLISHVCELMTDPCGHKVLQNLLEKCTDEQITIVLNRVIHQAVQFVRICGDSNGSVAVQVLMGRLCSEEQISRFMVTVCHVALQLTKSTNAHDVIMFCFDNFSPLQTNCLLEVILQNFLQVATDQPGSCMLQKCIEKSPREIRDPLIRETIFYAVSLCTNRYGNYVVQLLVLNDRQVAGVLSTHLQGSYVQLSCDKYASHAVQKCLRSRQFNSRMIIHELLGEIDSLLVHPFGNYVIQTALDVSQDDMRSQLLYHIKKNCLIMRCNMYGRKVLEKLNLHD